MTVRAVSKTLKHILRDNREDVILLRYVAEYCKRKATGVKYCSGLLMGKLIMKVFCMDLCVQMNLKIIGVIIFTQKCVM